MRYHLEALFGGWRDEVTGKESEVLVADVELVLAVLIPFTKAGFANLVCHIEKVELVGAPRLLEQRAHPCSTAWCVRGEIQHDRHSTT